MAEAKSKIKHLQGSPGKVNRAAPRQHGTPRDAANPAGKRVAPKHTPGQRGSKKSF